MFKGQQSFVPYFNPRINLFQMETACAGEHRPEPTDCEEQAHQCLHTGIAV